MVLRLERPPSEGVLPVDARRAFAVVALIGVMGALAALVVLRASPFPPGGLAGDQGFRVAAVARDATHWFPVDFAYRGLPGYYPPLYFAVLGRLTALTGMPAYEAVKFGGIAVACLVPFVGFALWRHLTRDVTLALAVVIATLAFHDWYEPYAWLAAIAFVPWWFAFVVRPRAAPRLAASLLDRRVVVGSLVGAAIVLTYYYSFFIGVTHLIVVVVASRLWPRRWRLTVDRESVAVLAGSAVLSSPYWAPIVVRAIVAGGLDSLQNRYFERWMIDLPHPFLGLSIEALVMLAGLVALVALTARGDTLAAGLLSLVGAAYLWFVFGYVAVLADTPVLAYRSVAVIQVVLCAGAGLGAVHLVRAGPLRPPLAVALGAVVAFVMVTTAAAGIPYVAEQRAARAPVAIEHQYDTAVAGHAPPGVVLTSASELLAVRPVALFNVWNAHYANPFAQFADRSAFLARLASERDAGVVAAALRHNRYDRVGVVVLARAGNALTYTEYEDAFPRGTRERVLHFRAGQFAAPWFRATDGTRHLVLVATRADPLPTLDGAQLAELRHHFAGDLASS